MPSKCDASDASRKRRRNSPNDDARPTCVAHPCVSGSPHRRKKKKGKKRAGSDPVPLAAPVQAETTRRERRKSLGNLEQRELEGQRAQRTRPRSFSSPTRPVSGEQPATDASESFQTVDCKYQSIGQAFAS